LCEEEFAEIRRRVIQRIDVTKECTDDEIREIIDEEVIQFCKNHQGDMPSIQERLICRNELFDSIRGYDILEKLLFDDDITEIMINGPNDIFIEKHHIIPKHYFKLQNSIIDNSNDNIIYLTPKQHLKIHLLIYYYFKYIKDFEMMKK
jgi:Flp pilus assembly CpaF family ATPase